MFEFPKRSFIASLVFLLISSGIVFFIVKVILKVGELSGYSLKIVAPSAEGLGVGSPIVLSGVQIGKVSKIQLSEDGLRAIITADIKMGVKITKDAKVEFRMKGILGDRIIAFRQGKSSEYLKDGDIIIIGEEEGGIGKLSEGAAEVLVKFSEVADSLKILLNNINEFIIEIREEKIASSIGSSARNLDKTIMEINYFVRDIRDVLHDVESIVKEINPALGEFSKDITETSKNVKEASFKLKNLLEVVEKDGFLSLAGEDGDKLRETIRGFEKISQRVSMSLSKADNVLVGAEKIVEGVGSIDVGARLEGGILQPGEEVAVHTAPTMAFSPTLFASFRKNKAFLELGIVSPPDIESLRFNSILGIYPLSSLGIGVGFLRSQPSFLLELSPFDFLFIRGENIGFSEPNLRGLIGGRYRFFKFYGGVENIINHRKFFLLGFEIKG